MMNAVIHDVTLYTVTTNTDLEEGRGQQVIIGVFTSPRTATESARGLGPQGQDATIHSEDVQLVKCDDERTYILGSEVNILYENPKTIRERALGKLTLEERIALGLK